MPCATDEREVNSEINKHETLPCTFAVRGSNLVAMVTVMKVKEALWVEAVKRINASVSMGMMGHDHHQQLHFDYD